MATNNNRTMVFLLGGHDLEMMTIKQILKSQKESQKEINVEVCDNNLEWGAKLSAYAKELAEYADKPNCEIYGIELNEDCRKPSNYHAIDHHNDLHTNPSSLEQVTTLFNIELTDDQKLIAANDRGYIPEMLSLLGMPDPTTDNEYETKANDLLIKIRGIRERELKILDIPVENKELTRKVFPRLTVIESNTDKFSAVSDLFYLEHMKRAIENKRSITPINYAIYKKKDDKVDGQWCFYGDPSVVSALAALYRKDVVNSVAYRGKGYFGHTKWNGKEEIFNEIAKLCESYAVLEGASSPMSYHIFYCPFRWKSKTLNKKKFHTFEDDTRLEDIVLNGGQWSDGTCQTSPNSYDMQVLYNEKNYFYNFCHRMLYDDPSDKKEKIVRHFERKKGKEQWTYIIQVKVKAEIKEYRLDIDAINLNFYSTGIGMLSFYLRNTEHTDPEDVLRINQYGRRIFPPFFADIADRTETPVSIGLELGDTNSSNNTASPFKETFDGYGTKSINKKASFIDNLIHEAICTEKIEIQNSPGIDDRMFVLSWYYNPQLVAEFHDGYSEPLESYLLKSFMAKNNFWYRYVFVDGGSWATCQCQEMYDKLLADATYTRWAKLGSLYGISRYSLVMLSNASGVDEVHIYRTMTTIYARMAEMVLMQRASMLRFSSEISDISVKDTDGNLKTLHQKADSLQKSYIRFINLMLPHEVTAQDQGIEMYDMLCNQLRVKEMQHELAGEIKSLHEYISLKQDIKNNVWGWILTCSAMLISLCALFGQYVQIKWGNYSLCQIICTLLCVIIFISMVISAMFFWGRKKQN